MKDSKFSHKVMALDVETTGPHFWEHGIHQIAAVMFVDGTEVDRFSLRVKPHPAVRYVPDALAVSGTTMDDIAGFTPHLRAHKVFTEWLGKHINKFDRTDKAHILGYNCQAFDMPFLRAFFKQAGDDYFNSWFYPETLDVFVLAGYRLRKFRPLMEKFKLHTVAEALEIPVNESRLHDADYDVELTISIYDKILSNI